MWAVAIALLILGLASLAAPAFGQAGGSVQYNAVCQNIIGSIGDINAIQAGTANATATQYSEAIAVVAQEQNVSIAQVNQCLNEAADNGNPPGGNTTNGDTTNGGTTNGGDTTNGDTTSGGDTTDANTTATTNSNVPAEVIVDTIPEQKVLADTGGPLILLPALGLIFVTAGATMLRSLLRR